MKNPFTDAGFQALQNDFQTLPHGQRVDVCVNILDDFRVWALRHFDLNSCERIYLFSLNDEFIRVMAFHISLAMEYHVPIKIVNEIKKTDTDDEEYAEIILTTEPNFTFATVVKKGLKMPQEIATGQLIIRIKNLERPE